MAYALSSQEFFTLTFPFEVCGVDPGSAEEQRAVPSDGPRQTECGNWFGVAFSAQGELPVSLDAVASQCIRLQFTVMKCLWE